MIINSQTLYDLKAGFQLLFDAGFQKAKPDWQKVAMEIKSMKSQEVYGWLGKTTKFREWAGDRVIQNLKAHDFTIKNVSYENTVGVDRDDIEDDNLGLYSTLLQQMGMDSANHPEDLVFSLLKNGFNQLCYDGQYFFDTDHPVIGADGVTYSASNHGGGSGDNWFLLDTSKVVQPLIFQKRRDYTFIAMDDEKSPDVFKKKEFQYGIDARVNAGYALWQLAYGSKQPLNAANLKAARTAMESLKGDDGKPLRITPNLLVVGPSLRDAGTELLYAERNSSGATNTLRGTAELLVTPYIS
jgi:phage major head subunit gpT-like protein